MSETFNLADLLLAYKTELNPLKRAALQSRLKKKTILNYFNADDHIDYLTKCIDNHTFDGLSGIYVWRDTPNSNTAYPFSDNTVIAWYFSSGLTLYPVTLVLEFQGKYPPEGFARLLDRYTRQFPKGVVMAGDTQNILQNTLSGFYVYPNLCLKLALVRKGTRPSHINWELQHTFILTKTLKSLGINVRMPRCDSSQNLNGYHYVAVKAYQACLKRTCLIAKYITWIAMLC